ncbi:hypothetical protein FALCPG4_018782 [Fusarium falciforme]
MSRFLGLLALTSFFCICVALQPNSVKPVNFQPNRQSTYINSRVPALYDLSKDQESGSYWTSTFLTATTGKQYLAISHVLGNVCKSSVLELSSLEYWNDLTYTETQDTSPPSSNLLDIRLSNCGLGSTSEDKISRMYTYGNTENYSYNISWEATSKVLLNGGGGAFAFGPGYTNTTQWSLPACKTNGTLTVRDRVLNIDPARSFTWYDHQKGAGAPQNWTWFELHFPDSSIKASIWVYHLPQLSSTSYSFATVRVGEESQYVVAVDLTPDMSGAWTSPNTNVTYPLSWRLDFENGDYLLAKSVRPDQEIYGPKQLGDSVYAGYATVSGRFFGQRVGYGVVEMITLY